MQLVLDVPNTFSNGTERIACQGVVVRSKQNPNEQTGGYETAIFFTQMSGEDRSKLERFVDDYLANEVLTAL